MSRKRNKEEDVSLPPSKKGSNSSAANSAESILYCGSYPTPLNNVYMEMNILSPLVPITGYSSSSDPIISTVLPLLQGQGAPGQKTGLNGEISLSSIRLQTINVIYRGLCYLSDQIIRTSMRPLPIKKNSFKFIFTLPSQMPSEVDFTDFFLNNKITRDDLSGQTMRNADSISLEVISFLEFMLPIYPALSQDISLVINCFILCSSGKEYLDVGQLYATVDHNNGINSSVPTNFWGNQAIIDRATSDIFDYQQIPELPPSIIPVRPFFETYDGAAARIAGKYFSVYTESTSSTPERYSISGSLTSSLGSIPYIFDSINVLYLAFLYYSIQKNYDETMTAPELDAIRAFIPKIKAISAITTTQDIIKLFDLLYFILVTNIPFIIQYYTNRISNPRYIQYRLIDNDIIYNLLSSVVYLCDSNITPDLKQSLILLYYVPCRKLLLAFLVKLANDLLNSCFLQHVTIRF